MGLDGLLVAKWLWGKAAPVLPGLILKRLYPVPKQVKSIDFSVVGQPHIYIVPGYRMRVQHLGIKVINQLPFSVEIECMTLLYSVKNRELFKAQVCLHKQVDGYSKIEDSCEHELSENQAAMLNIYPGPSVTVDVAFDVTCRTRTGLLKLTPLWQGDCRIHRTPD